MLFLKKRRLLFAKNHWKLATSFSNERFDLAIWKKSLFWFLANTITFILAMFLNFVNRRSGFNFKKRIFSIFWPFLALFWPYLYQKLTQKHIFGGISVMKSVYILFVNISINLESFENFFQLHKLKNLKKFLTFLGGSEKLQ